MSSTRVIEGGPEKANDGDVNGDWFGGSVTCSNSDPQAWWEVDLEAVYTVNQVNIWNRTDIDDTHNYPARLTDFYVIVSKEPFQSQELNATLAQEGVWIHHVQGQCGTPTSLEVGGYQGRYVRVQLAGTEFLHLAEVEVLGGPALADAPELVAIGDNFQLEGEPYTGPVPELIQGRVPVVYSLVEGPAGMTIDPDSGVVNWASPIAAGSPHNITIRAANPFGYDDESWQLKVAAYVVNVALNKPATMSSIRVPEGGPEKANDGDTNGDWSGGSVTCSNADPQAWWEVDLQAVHEINRIYVWNRTDVDSSHNYPARLVNFYVIVSRSPFVSQDLNETLAQEGVWAYNVTGQCGTPTFINVVGTMGRYVRVQLVGTNYLHLAEVELLSSSAPPEVPVIGEINDHLQAAGVPYDGPAPVLSQGRAPITWSLTNGPAGLTVDPASGVVNWPSPTSTGSPHNVTIRATNAFGYDEENWQIRVATDLANVALNKPATMSSVRVPEGGPEKANDGNTNGDWSGGSVTCSNADPQAWWEVDLGGVHEISQINVWNRTDIGSVDYGARLTNFYVIVSATPFVSQELEQTLSQAGVKAYHVPSRCGTPTTLDLGSLIGRYVRVQLVGTNYLHLAEVEVFGVPGTPAVPVIMAIADQSVAEDAYYTSPTPTLAQGAQPVTWSLVTAPTGITINADTGVVIWPSPDSTGSPYTVTIRAANTGGFDDETWQLTVTGETLSAYEQEAASYQPVGDEIGLGGVGIPSIAVRVLLLDEDDQHQQ